MNYILTKKTQDFLNQNSNLYKKNDIKFLMNKTLLELGLITEEEKNIDINKFVEYYTKKIDKDEPTDKESDKEYVSMTDYSLNLSKGVYDKNYRDLISIYMNEQDYNTNYKNIVDKINAMIVKLFNKKINSKAFIQNIIFNTLTKNKTNTHIDIQKEVLETLLKRIYIDLVEYDINLEIEKYNLLES